MITDISVAVAGGKGSQEYLLALAMQAYGDDLDTYSKWVETISRMQ